MKSLDAVKVPTTIAHAGYTYDDAGNRTTKTLLEYGETYHYDPLYRLKEVDRPDPMPVETYTYDKVGNRKTSIGCGSGRAPRPF